MTEDITAEVERAVGHLALMAAEDGPYYQQPATCAGAGFAETVTWDQIRALVARCKIAEFNIVSMLKFTDEVKAENATLREQVTAINLKRVQAEDAVARYNVHYPAVCDQRDALREQLAEREEAAFRAGWGLAGGVINKITLTTALAAWRASQKGAP